MSVEEERKAAERQLDYKLVVGAVPSSGALLAFATSNWYVLFWALWITAFFAVELPAVFNAKKGDTLSEQIWRWFRIRGGRKRTTYLTQYPDGSYKKVRPFPLWLSILIRTAIVIGGVWLTGHMAFGLWGGHEGLWFG